MLGAMNNTDESDPAAITPDDLRELMADLGLTAAALARLVAVDKSTPGRWLSGAVPVPAWVGDHLAALLALRRICRAVWDMPEDAEPAPLPVRLAHLAETLNGKENAKKIATEGLMGVKIEPMQKASDETHKMSPEDFRKALAALGWRQADFVRRVGCGTSTANRWAQGKAEIPEWVSAHLSLLGEIAKLHTAYVQPQRERKAGGTL